MQNLKAEAKMEFEFYIFDADGGDREGPYPYTQGKGGDDDGLNELLATLEVGESIREGGGSSPIFEYKRIS